MRLSALFESWGVSTILARLLQSLLILCPCCVNAPASVAKAFRSLKAAYILLDSPKSEIVNSIGRSQGVQMRTAEFPSVMKAHRLALKQLHVYQTMMEVDKPKPTHAAARKAAPAPRRVESKKKTTQVTHAEA